MSTKTPTLAWDKKFTGLVNNGIFPNVLNRVCILVCCHSLCLVVRVVTVVTIKKDQGVAVSRVVTGVAGCCAAPLDDLIGGWALVDNRTVWIDGPAVRCLRQGKILQIDEGNNVPHECQTVFYALCDEPAGLTLPNGERVEASPGYGVVITMNPDPSELPHPVYDRFDVYLKATTLSDGIKTALGQFADPAQNVIGCLMARPMRLKP